MTSPQKTPVKHFNLVYNRKNEKNKARVRKHRYFRKLKAIHEKKIYERIYSKKNESNNETFNNYSGDLPIVNKGTEIEYRLKYWAMQHRISKIALNDLLSILNHAGLSLPRDSRTLMGTPKSVPIEILSNGQLWYCGIKTCIRHEFAGIQKNISITLHFNFDGLPIAKSSNKQFWPILSSIEGTHLI